MNFENCVPRVFSRLFGDLPFYVGATLLLGSPVIAVALVDMACLHSDMLNVGTEGYRLDSFVFDGSLHPAMATTLEWLGCFFLVVMFSLFVAEQDGLLFDFTTRRLLAYLLLVLQISLAGLLLLDQPPYCEVHHVICDNPWPRGKVLLTMALVAYVMCIDVVRGASQIRGDREQEAQQEAQQEAEKLQQGTERQHFGTFPDKNPTLGRGEKEG